MNLPNILTLSRLGLAFVLIPLLVFDFPYGKTAALVLFIIGALTDYLDGRLARNVYGVTQFGSLMDPVTDKVMVCAAFITFVELQIVKAIVVVIIVAREFMVTGLRLLALNDGQVISAGKWGKHKTVWQLVAIILILLGLAIRDDLLRNRSAELIASYDRLFTIGSHTISIAVAVITVLSGVMYMIEHKSLITKAT